MRSTNSLFSTLMLLMSLLIPSSVAFSPSTTRSLSSASLRDTTTTSTSIRAAEDSSPEDPKDVIGKTIQIKGDVNGGYVRTCIRNEASQFRRLIGTMSPPSDDDTATIYVEGKRKMVDGFVRWCQKGTAKVGLSQTLEVVSATEEVPTGLYDGFYVKMVSEDEE
mmetsp:Transcript_12650/g.18452  ORF Transcript_12650/g.18452 Transcript_12650/m.18452 type:complete len:164 (+) Transcript_12650:126-617(+)|eukprot:CAMPEP_0197233890 /NCGR_PEP_ID=MMETSP1429-20130617/1817_1 /TAXON_ID=49237 /ORGANISM="Chaetoceros  sp., Strain UNC1202" /LENGTH=163 /DNA_ID=CAMNT_0042692207 /DNA_START=109 /DNA_END=600 /DNA_ORIENTATION=+